MEEVIGSLPLAADLSSRAEARTQRLLLLIVKMKYLLHKGVALCPSYKNALGRVLAGSRKEGDFSELSHLSRMPRRAIWCDVRWHWRHLWQVWQFAFNNLR